MDRQDLIIMMIMSLVLGVMGCASCVKAHDAPKPLLHEALVNPAAVGVGSNLLLPKDLGQPQKSEQGGELITGEQAYARGDIQTAFQSWLVEAEIGKVVSMYRVGTMMLDGHGTKQDATEGLKWVTKAAENGYVDAQGLMGRIYAQGRLVLADYKKAAHWFQKAAEQGHPIAQKNAGLMFYLGKGVDQDFTKAHSYFSKSARQGNSEAMLYLASLYETGLGADKDSKESLKWLRLSADFGYPKAQNKLGTQLAESSKLYDQKEAYKWFYLASTRLSGKDKSIASFNLRKLSESLDDSVVEVIKQQAEAWRPRTTMPKIVQQ